ncbi:MAG TPA: hypothetical protein VL475_08080 [Planctomycetaceae bacterium]|nr:hypothetical protein [Planctomycetaceae bacterium]
MSPGKMCCFVGGAILVLLLYGCGGTPQFSAANRDLLKPLQTAVSAKKLEWVAATEEKIRAQREAGAVSDEELAAMNAVIAKARAGDWQGAQVAVFALVDGQRATAEDLANLEQGKKRPAAKHKHRH